jgi:hypothetical protein
MDDFDVLVEVIHLLKNLKALPLVFAHKPSPAMDL